MLDVVSSSMSMTVSCSLESWEYVLEANVPARKGMSELMDSTPRVFHRNNLNTNL